MFTGSSWRASRRRLPSPGPAWCQGRGIWFLSVGEPPLEESLAGADPLQGEALFDVPPGADDPYAAPLALYRRYRPDTFTDVIGQEHVTEPLQRALTNNRVNHAYL